MKMSLRKTTPIQMTQEQMARQKMTPMRNQRDQSRLAMFLVGMRELN